MTTPSTPPTSPTTSTALAITMTTETIVRLPLDELHESPFNPRRTFHEAGLQELAADIKAQDILSPLLVRPRIPELFRSLADAAQTAACGYELVFGHRRLRAARLAELASVPCMVRPMSDAEAKRAQISENLAREDVHPIEEAEGFQALIDDKSETADSLAERYGKSRSYVYGRLTLLKACPTVRDACVAGKIGSEVALLIARLRTERLQKKALGYIEGKYIELGDGGAKSYRQIRELLRERFTLSLKGKACMFDPADAALLPDAGACTTCPRRTGNAPEFADMLDDSKGAHGYVYSEGDPELCTDPDCFEAKKTAHLRAEAAELARKGKTVVDGAKARAAIGADGTVKGAYLPLKDVKDAIQKARQAAQRDSSIVPPQIVTIQDPRTGKTVEAVKASDLTAAGVKVSPAAERAEHSYKEQQRRQEEQRKRDEVRAAELAQEYGAVLQRVRAAIAAAPRSAFDLGLVARTTLAGVQYNDRPALASLYGVARFEVLEKQLGQMDVPELTTLMMDCALIAGTRPRSYDVNAKPDVLLAAAKHYGIDPSAVRAALAQASAAASPPSTAARAPNKGKSAARAGGAKVAGPAVRYRDAATGSTWTGRGLMPAWLKAELARGSTLADFEIQARAPAARAPGKTAPRAAGQDGASAGFAGEGWDTGAGSAGKEQTDDAGAGAGGSTAEVTS